MRTSEDMAVALRDAPEGKRVVDLSCGRCLECSAGAPLWCLDPSSTGRDLTPALAEDSAEEALTALLAAAALLEAPSGTAVLVAEGTGSLLSAVTAHVSGDRPLVAGDPADDGVRKAMAALDATGRAPVVVSAGDARRAVKAVRRGGYVCVPAGPGEQPTITELVQREVTLIGPRSLSRVLDALPEDALRAALRAL